MSKDNTCSGFFPDGADEPGLLLQGPPDGTIGPVLRVLPRPVVEREAAKLALAELDDLIRWCAELASSRRSAGISTAPIDMAYRGLVLSAAQKLGAARSLVIAGEQA